MKNYEKVLTVLLMGSLWGAVELFGADLFRAWHVPSKSALLFGLAVVIMYASKRINHFPGSVILMALVASLFKTASASFYACQAAAVIIIGTVFDGTYSLLKDLLDSKLAYRALAAPVIAYLSYSIFAFIATYVIQDANWAASGMKGIGEYLSASALYAAGIGIVTMNLGYYLGVALQRFLQSARARATATYLRLASCALVVFIWVAGQIY